MKIIKNTSVYDTRALRSIFCIVHNHMKKLMGHSAPRWKLLEIKVQNKEYGTSGCAFYGGCGRDWDVFFSLCPGLTEHDVAWIAYHEFMHTYGHKHSAYSNIPKTELNVLFPDNKLVEIVKNKATTPVWITRYNSAVKRQKQWESKARRAKNALKKVNKTVVYYEKKYAQELN